MALEELLLENMAVSRQLLAALTPRTPGADRAFSTKEVDLTSAHTNLEVSVGDFRWVQFWCDGSPIGITVGIATQDNVISLEKFSTVPVVSGTKVYVTNDVRSGRSKLLLVFSRTAPLESYLGGQISLAEVAARLGSIHTFDRRGNILWYDDFEDGLNKWEVSLSGTGPSVALTNAQARKGALSCKLVSGTSGGAYSQINAYLPYNILSRMGFESAFTANGDTEYTWRFWFYDGTNYYEASVTYSATDWLEIWTTAGWVAVANVPLLHSDSLFHILKLVVDPITHKYVRLILNNTEYDVSASDMLPTANATAPHTLVTFRVTKGSSGDTVYIDNVIVTQNEP